MSRTYKANKHFIKAQRARTDKSKAMTRNAKVSKRKLRRAEVVDNLTSTGDWIH